ncbi:probable chitinase 10 [Belonocnema kinseyi]|uniref:probable chitinase 10 n=1 Tax=Belonocnema kinseyi TaxID=2817044 RepID=UPI00143D6B6C|nr:probable chitinase 10 [Belonocnema kinseyi]
MGNPVSSNATANIAVKVMSGKVKPYCDINAEHLRFSGTPLMYKLILLLGICSAFASGASGKHTRTARMPGTDKKCQKIINCYSSFQGDDQTDDHLCTNIFFGLANIEKDASVQMANDNIGMDTSEFQGTNDHREKNRHFKTFVAMQDDIWDGSHKNTKNKILFNPTLREKLVDNILNFVEKHKFDGIDLQSQYLTQEDANDSDKQNFVLLLKALKEKFDKKGLLLALAVEGIESIAKRYDIKGISKYVTFINLRAYNLHGDLYTDGKILKSGHLAPLYHSSKENTKDKKLNVDSIVKYWISKGAPPNKLILGTTLKAMTYTLAKAKKVSKDEPFVDTVKYRSTTTSYAFTCPNEKDRTWKQIYDKEQQVPYMYKGKNVIGYENVASIKKKAEYAKSMKLAGLFVDSLEDDDMSGFCGRGNYPLLKTVNQVLGNKC